MDFVETVGVLFETLHADSHVDVLIHFDLGASIRPVTSVENTTRTVDGGQYLLA